MAKRRKSLWLVAGVLVLIVVALGVVAYFISEQAGKPKFILYREFGISIPANYFIHGIDVSRYQRNIGWKEVQHMQVNDVKIGFAFIKATEGLGRVDEQFRRNWFQAKQHNIPRGAYHFFIGSKSGKAQAENFMETVQLEKGDLPPVLDVEQANGASVADLQQRVADWLALVEKKYGVRPIIYCNVDFYENYLAGRFDHYPLWVAHYKVRDKPRIERKWIFWQHSESGQVNGIEPKVDFNVFNGDSFAFRKLLLR